MKTTVKELGRVRVEKAAAELLEVRAALKALKEREKLLKADIKSGFEDMGYDTSQNISGVYGGLTVSISHTASIGIDTEALKKNDWYEALKAEFPKVTNKETIRIK